VRALVFRLNDQGWEMSETMDRSDRATSSRESGAHGWLALWLSTDTRANKCLTCEKHEAMPPADWTPGWGMILDATDGLRSREFVLIPSAPSSRGVPDVG
jgi:hypothetical protein